MEAGNIVDYLVSTGHLLAKKTANEWAGACPFCGGENRLVVFTDGGRPKISVSGHFFCRQCGWKGDYATWLIEVEKLSPREVLRGTTPHQGHHEKNGDRNEKPYRKFSVVSVSEPWSSRAEATLSSAWQEMSKPGAVEFYQGRGLTPDTCEALVFGWQSHDRFFDTEAWGLEAGKKLVVPAGCVLPVYRSGRVVSLLVRRSNRSQWEKFGKWCEVKGGARVPFLCGTENGKPLVVVESILCAASVFQATGGAVAAVATLGATKGKGRGLDKGTVEALKSAEVVLVAGDRDEAGAALLSALQEIRPDAFAYRVPAKVGGSAVSDVNDLLQVAGARYVREWVQYGIEKARTARGEPFGQARQESEGETTASSSSAKQGEAHATEAKEASIEVPDTVGEALNNVEPADPVEAVEVVERDTFAETVAAFREAFPDGPPMLCQDMPDWYKFCCGWYQSCDRCPYYDANPNGSPCTIWEACFPGAVKWYPPLY